MKLPVAVADSGGRRQDSRPRECRAWHKGFRWFRYPPELHLPIQFLHHWLQEAAGEEQGLVGYYA